MNSFYLYVLSCLFLGCWFGSVWAADDPQVLSAQRVTEPPRIDGQLDDAIWQDEGFWEGKFVQNRPDAGKPSLRRSKVWVRYDDRALYIAAQLYDPQPDSIQRELGLRDDFDRNADYFSVNLDPFLQGQNAFVFSVSAAGVQGDGIVTPNNWDTNWDAVWESAVSINDEGWAVELEIPYYAFRFPKKDVQSWGINFYRRVQRFQEVSFWNFVDPNINGEVNQYGVLKGIREVQPPLRLQLFPFVTGYVLREPGEERWGTAVTGGMDLKYGINESFTLDLSLIPDFGQVRSDNLVLNLSPFEVRFDENRQFFTEGVELFDRGPLFYSRRIGATFGEVRVPEAYRLISLPTEAPLLNAAKLSGRTPRGLGVGLLNAITRPTYAVLEDTATGERIEQQVDPLTNFNVLVFDQNLPNNSNVAFMNTNVTREGRAPDANVSRVDFRLFDRTNTYRLLGNASMSARMYPDSAFDPGYRYRINFAKVSGRVRFVMSRLVESYDFDSNDLGFLRASNEITHYTNLTYQRNEPTGIFNRYDFGTEFTHTALQRPYAYEEARGEVFGRGTFRNFWTFGGGVGYNLGNDDHFEARLPSFPVWKKPASYNTWLWFESDERKAFYIGADMGFWQRPEWNQFDNWGGLFLRYRFSNKLTLSYGGNLNWRRREVGFVQHVPNPDKLEPDVRLGRRFVVNNNHEISGRFTFNNRMGLTGRIRHYWSRVNYLEYYRLLEGGGMADENYDGRNEDGSSRHDANYNALNIDIFYQWQIGPGSFLNIVWKQGIDDFQRELQPTYYQNFRQQIWGAPSQTSISIRLIYFLDYLKARDFLRGDRKERFIGSRRWNPRKWS